MIQLTKDSTATPNVYSEGDGTNPVTVSLTLDGTSTPTHITGNSIDSVYVWANNLNAVSDPVVNEYTDVALTLIDETDAGIDWELSLNGSTGWANTINVVIPVVAAGYQTVQVWARAIAINNGSVPTNNYTATRIRLTAVERPIT